MATYRIFEIVTAPRISDYEPYGGEQWFGKTLKVGTSLVGEYDTNGPADLTLLPAYAGTWPIPTGPQYRTMVRPGEIIELMGNVGYAKVYRAAYPPGSKPEDDEALFFMERSRFPTSADGLIDVLDPTVTTALDYFIVQNYITAADKTRIQQGVED